MTNEELIKQLVEKKLNAQIKTERVETETQKYLVVAIGEKKYAFFAQNIREIVLDSDIFFVPFVPEYVQGLINRHG
ncbi:MAG: hypothetical protein MJB14_09210, partial [Spirochaetes bacterium]|nr:hypothetical protein [Spirochaetota bacterium]